MKHVINPLPVPDQTGVTGVPLVVYVVRMIIVTPLPSVKNPEDAPPVVDLGNVTNAQHTVIAVDFQHVMMVKNVMFVTGVKNTVYVV